jgi:hypothetical protein
MNRRGFRTLRLPGGCIQGTKGNENYIGVTQQTALSREEEEEEEERKEGGEEGEEEEEEEEEEVEE